MATLILGCFAPDTSHQFETRYKNSIQNSKCQVGGEAVRLLTSVLFSNRPAIVNSKFKIQNAKSGAKRSAYRLLFYFPTSERKEAIDRGDRGGIAPTNTRYGQVRRRARTVAALGPSLRQIYTNKEYVKQFTLLFPLY